MRCNTVRYHNYGQNCFSTACLHKPVEHAFLSQRGLAGHAHAADGRLGSGGGLGSEEAK